MSKPRISYEYLCKKHREDVNRDFKGYSCDFSGSDADYSLYLEDLLEKTREEVSRLRAYAFSGLVDIEY